MVGKKWDCGLWCTPLKIDDVEPKNAGLEDDLPDQLGVFEVPC